LNHFPHVREWHLAPSILPTSLAELALDGEKGNEGIMLWLGRRLGNVATVTHLVALRGGGIIKRPQLLRLSDHLINDITDLAIELNVALLGHIHGHPENFVDLSYTDRTYGFAVPGFLSVVAPYYGMRQDVTLNECGVHVYESGSGYRRLARAEVNQRLVFQPDLEPQIHILGDSI